MDAQKRKPSADATSSKPPKSTTPADGARGDAKTPADQALPAGAVQIPVAVAPDVAAASAAARVTSAAQDKSLRESDQYGFYARAQAGEKAHEVLAVARFDGLQRVDGQDAAGQRVTVQPRTRAWLLPLDSGAPTELRPGMYQLSNLPLRGRRTRGEGDTKVAQLYTYHVLCRTSDLPVSATFVLPDLQAFAERTAEDWSAALNEVNLRTSDNLLGGARGQIGLLCTDPVRLIQAFGEDKVAAGKVLDDIAPQERPRGNPIARAFRSLYNYVAGREEPGPDFFARIPPFTFADLYRLIRLELMGSLRASIRRQSAASLYDTNEAREEVQRDLCRDLADTLAGYGLQIQRVTAFQFTSPAYEYLLQKRGTASLDERMVAVERAEAETKDQRRELWQEDKKKDHRAEQDVRRDVVGEDARTKELEDQHAADDQVRRLQRDGYLKDYNRDQARLDEEQKIRLLEEKARMALRMQEEQLRIQRQDQLETMRAYAELPADKLLQVAMIQHPHLVAAFQAAQGADNLQQQIAMLNQFRDQLTGVYGENRDQIQKLMLAAVQQIGAIGGNRRGDGGGREDAPAGRDARTLPPQTVQVLIPPATNQAIPSPNPPGQELE